jgi:hypothetical protein
MKLSLRKLEKKQLRDAKITLIQLIGLTGTQLSKCSGISLQRCNYLVALCQFQSLDAVGVTIAEQLWQLGYTSLQTLAKADSTRLYQDYCRLTRNHATTHIKRILADAIIQAKHKQRSGDREQQLNRSTII